MTPFTIEHRFEGAILEQVERLYMLDEAFNEATFKELGFDRRVVATRHDGDELDRLLRLCPHHAVPKPFSSLMPSGSFYIEEHVRYRFDRHAGTFVTRPSLLHEQFRAEGQIELIAIDGSVVFRLVGEAHARLSLLSKSAEKQAVRSAHEQHAGLASAIRLRIASARAQPAAAAW